MANPEVQLFSSLRYDPLLVNLSINNEFSGGEGPKESSPFYMLSLHRDRILQAAEHFHYEKAVNVLRNPQGLANILRTLKEAIDTQSTRALRVRILMSHDGIITVESNSTPEVTKENLYPSRLPPPKTAAHMKVSPLTGGPLTLGDGDSVAGDPSTSNPWDIIPDLKRTAPTPYTSFKTTSRDMYSSARERIGIKDMAEKREVLLISNEDGEIMEGSLTSPYFWRNGKWTTPAVSSGGQIGTTRRWALEKGYVLRDRT